MLLASSAASPEARTSSCNSRGHRKAVPCCAPFRGQKVEGRSVHIEAIDAQSIQICRAMEARNDDVIRKIREPCDVDNRDSSNF